MVAPTALKKSGTDGQTAPEPAGSRIVGTDNTLGIDDDDDILIDQEDSSAAPAERAEDAAEQQGVVLDAEGKPRFAAAASVAETRVKAESRKVPVPPHRMTPLRNNWTKIYPPLVDHLKLQVRMNLKTKSVELRTHPRHTTDPGALQKGADFIKAFTLGFDLDDSISLLRLDDLYIETFEIKDVKTLHGDHLSRAIGRIAGKDGKTKFAIENATRTRIVLADSKIHILGGFTHIRMAREAVVSLILGSPPGKVYGNLRTVASRLKERY
ncbi:AaceriAFR390Cp [[Ashbya] aceris (nom. inval.)]|nr:AaceriAFR390Cp [[Ashbya] aceris (nom. inval.)]